MNTVELRIQLTDDEAWNRAQFLVRIGFADFRNHATSDGRRTICATPPRSSVARSSSAGTRRPRARIGCASRPREKPGFGQIGTDAA